MEKFKVLHLTSGEDRHGGKISVLNIINESRKNMDVELGVLAEGALTQAAKDQGLKVVAFMQRRRIDFSVVFKISRYVKKNKILLVHCHGPRANFLGVFLKHLLKVPIITTIHSDFMLDDFKGGRLANLLFRSINSFAIKSLDSYICVSKEMRDRLIERKYPLDKTYVAYNGVDFNDDPLLDPEALFKKYKIPYDQNAVYIGILGRLAAVKNHIIFLQGAKKALEENQALYFIIGGDGELEDKLRNFIESEGLGDHVFMLGHVDRPHEFFQMIDINVLTSNHEGGVPYAIMEGAVYNKPALATSVGGNKELVYDKITGRLFDVGDFNGFAEALLEMVANQAYKAYGLAMGNYARMHFDVSSMGTRYKSIYDHIVAKKKKIFIIGYYGQFNLGDEAILNTTIDFLRNLDPPSEITVLSYQKKLTRKHSNVEAVSRNDLIGVIKTLIKSNVLILGGGTLLQTASSKRSLWYYLGFVWLAKRSKNKKVMMLGNGFGPIDGNLSRKLCCNLLETLDLILLRDQGSKEYMESLGVKHDHIHVTTDFVYALDNIDASHVKLENRVGINVRKWACDETAYRHIAAYADQLVEEGKAVYFLPFELEDNWAISKVMSYMKSPAEHITFTPICGEVLKTIGSFEMFLSMRLHGMIFASLTKTPFIGIAYDPKIYYLCKEMHYPYVVDIHNLKEDTLNTLMATYDQELSKDLMETYVTRQRQWIDESQNLIDTYLK